MQDNRHPRRGESGATLVEFALVFPVAILLICGIIGGCYLAYQNSALHDGATAGARMASIETNLAILQNTGPNTGSYCESDAPVAIEKTVSQAVPLLTVNPAQLCAPSATATQLTQSPQVNGDVNITVICGGSCASPTSTAVDLAFGASGIVAPFGLGYHMSATSQVPVLSP
jgi:Flp pilus assembly protein TadG